jgi:putative AdoMet-dependent methyltransferase
MTDLYPASDFDEWAKTYDESVITDAFPFGAYTKMIERIVELSQPNPKMDILDLGTGTGAIASRFTALGCTVVGLDFSHAMLEIAKQKVPAGVFLQADLREDFLPVLGSLKFDRIVSGFTFHHFPLNEKISILRQLAGVLKPDGFMVIGDISFTDPDSKRAVQISEGSNWEEEEYWIACESISKMKSSGMRVKYDQLNPYTGVYLIRVAPS